MNFKIEKENFELKFGFGVFYILGRHWKLQTFDQSLKKIMQAFGDYANLDVNDLNEGGIELSYEATEIMADMVIAAIVANKENGKNFDDFFLPDVVSAIIQNMNVVPVIMKELIASMPVQKQQPAPPGK